ncbi:MAG: flagellar hook-length control protein FliK [Deltaproteobacteria bacterium]|nr:flagellar hook-length control protein FliK [Deltaproteobacteria bacterium]
MADDIKVDQARDARLQDMKPKEQAKPKDKPSEFDRVLEQSQQRQLVKPLSNQQAQQAAEQGKREVRREEERDQGQRDRRNRDDEKGREGEQRDKKSDAKVSHERVVAKGQLKEQGSGAGAGGQDTRGGFGQTTRRETKTTELKQTTNRTAAEALAGKFEQQLKAKLASETQGPRLSQQVLNQLVQQVKFGLNQKGEKEMQIELQEKIFRGLKFKVTSRGGKVAVAFTTADRRTREIFEGNRDNIQRALATQGIKVDEILVS